jgi:hypothetical protein
MHAYRLLHTFLQKSCPTIHKTRLSSLMKAAQSLLNQGKLTLTSLGRHLLGSVLVKHKIKAMDRLLGNAALQTECLEVYRALTEMAIGGLSAIQILVDWSPCASHAHHILRASLVFRDRSITLYEEVHLEKHLGQRKIHKQFLKQLKKIIPLHCLRVLIVTDAGFRTDWFQQVLDMGWDYEGRVRGNMQYAMSNEGIWQPCTSLYKIATSRAKYIGHILLSKTNPLSCYAYLYKEKKAGKKNNKKKILQGQKKSTYSKSHNDPWLLVTSIAHTKHHGKTVVKKYKRRMKIEHEFRDSKDPKWGLGLNYTLTRNRHRLAILLLIGTVAIFMLWLIGLAAERKQLHYSYQANTVKSHRVLSLIFLALQILLHDRQAVCYQDLKEALQNAQNIEAQEYEQ